MELLARVREMGDARSGADDFGRCSADVDAEVAERSSDRDEPAHRRNERKGQPHQAWPLRAACTPASFECA